MPVTDGGLVMVAQGRGEGQRGGDAQLGAAPESNPGACTFPSKKKKLGQFHKGRTWIWFLHVS